MNSWEGILSALAGVPILRGARCRGRHELFDPQAEGEFAEVAEARHVQAVWICEACPALADCRAWVDSLPPRDRPLGVTAGVIRTAPKPRKRQAS